MRRKTFATKLIFALLLMVSVQSKAQKLIMEGEFRPRSEYRDGFQKPLLKDQKPAFAVFQRSRLGVKFNYKSVTSKMTLQDVRVWGQASVKSEAPPITLYEGWVGFDLYENLHLRAGRQAVKYDDNRLISSSSWSCNGLSHDLLLFKYNNKKIEYRLDVGAAYNNSSDIKTHADFYNLSKKMYKALSYLWTEKQFNHGVALSGIFIYELLEDSKDESIENQKILHFNRFTTGLNLKMNNKDFPLSFILTGYYQFGESRDHYISNNTLLHKKLSAYFLAAKLNYFINKHFTITAGSDLYSGTDYNNDSICNTWNKLYGSNHSFNGSMEYWRNIPYFGFADLYWKLHASDAKDLSFEVAFHYFMAQKKITAYENTSGNGLGSEVDFSMKWKIMKYAELSAGWSTYFNSKNTNIIKGLDKDADIRFQHWAFVALTFKPEFINSKLSFLN